MKNSDKELHERFKTYGANAREWMRKCVLMLVEIDDNRIWEKKGFKSLTHYAAVLAGMGRDTVNDGLRILRKTVNMPNVRKIIEARGIRIIKPIETILTIENEKFWAEKARKMSVHVLEQYVRDLRRHVPSENSKPEHQQAISNFNFEGESTAVLQLQNCEAETTPKTLVPMELSTGILQKLEKLKGQTSWNELFTQLLSERDEQLEETKPQAVKTDSRYIPAEIENYVIKRTNGTCAFPLCNKPFDEIHHTQRFSLTHEHNPDTLEILCADHHAIAHHGLIDNEDCPSINWKIKIEPDSNSPKFAVDQIVASYRAPK